jgi:hypothetical protein
MRRGKLGDTGKRRRRGPAVEGGGHCRGDGVEREEYQGEVREYRENTTIPTVGTTRRKKVEREGSGLTASM